VQGVHAISGSTEAILNQPSFPIPGLDPPLSLFASVVPCPGSLCIRHHLCLLSGPVESVDMLSIVCLLLLVGLASAQQTFRVFHRVLDPADTTLDPPPFSLRATLDLRPSPSLTPSENLQDEWPSLISGVYSNLSLYQVALEQDYGLPEPSWHISSVKFVGTTPYTLYFHMDIHSYFYSVPSQECTL